MPSYKKDFNLEEVIEALRRSNLQIDPRDLVPQLRHIKQGTVDDFMLCVSEIMTDHLQSSRHSGFRKQCRDWLQKFAKECYSFQLQSYTWISKHISSLPALKETEQFYQPIRAHQDPAFTSNQYIEARKAMPMDTFYHSEDVANEEELHKSTYGKRSIHTSSMLRPAEKRNSPSRKVSSLRNSKIDMAVSIPNSKSSSSDSLGKRKHTMDHISPSQAKRQQIQNLQKIKEDRKKKKMERRKRNVVCLVPDCHESGADYPKRHAFDHHLPTIFSENLVPGDSRVVNLRIQALLQATAWLLGHPGSLQELLDFLNKQGPLLSGGDQWSIGPTQLSAMTAICTELKLPIPQTFSFDPINHIAVLCHWRIVYMLSALLQSDHSKLWREHFAATDDFPYFHVAPVAVDSHFHLDRLRMSANLEHSPVKDVIEAITMPQLRSVDLKAAVANFCDPDTYPTDVELSQLPSEVRVCIGFHPKHSRFDSSWIHKSLDKMRTLLSHPRVSGIGEIGLDHSVCTQQWDGQIQLMEKILPLVKPSHILVLHCCGKSGDDGLEAHWLLLHLLKKGNVSPNQQVHLHSFDGDMLAIQCWLKAFPQTFFSYNRGVTTFNEDQRAALIQLDEDRLLLESDAPFFPSLDKEYSAPSELYVIAANVASIKKKKIVDILSLTAENALRLYP